MSEANSAASARALSPPPPTIAGASEYTAQGRGQWPRCGGQAREPWKAATHLRASAKPSADLNVGLLAVAAAQPELKGRVSGFNLRGALAVSQRAVPILQLVVGAAR